MDSKDLKMSDSAMSQDLAPSVGNPYLEEATRAGVRGKWMDGMKDRSYIRRSMDSFRERERLTKKYAWAIPVPEALAMLKKYSPLIEIGAGKGYWASLADADILCYDCHAGNPEVNYHVDSGKPYHKVYRGGHDRVAEHPERTLFLCWPPYDTEMGGDCLRAYKGDVLVFVGEGNGGCTGGSCFWSQIEEEWEEVEDVAIPQWYGINDWMTVYRRKNVEA